MRFVRVLVAVAGVIAAIAGLGWLGLQVRPKPFASYPATTPPLDSVAPPADLPEPVARYVRAAFGERIPVIRTAIISGRGWLRFSGITFPARWRFVYEAGQGYRHIIEAALFGQPLLKVNETYLNGQGRLELPFGVVENEPKVNQAANLGLWAEAIWLPSIWFTDPRVRWEAIDDHSARLIVPFGAEEQAFTVWFDSVTGLIRRMETLRWRDAGDAAPIVWRNEALAWMRAAGMQIPAEATVTWMDQGTPWLRLDTEEAIYNVEVEALMRPEDR